MVGVSTCAKGTAGDTEIVLEVEAFDALLADRIIVIPHEAVVGRSGLSIGEDEQQ